MAFTIPGGATVSAASSVLFYLDSDSDTSTPPFPTIASEGNISICSSSDKVVFLGSEHSQAVKDYSKYKSSITTKLRVGAGKAFASMFVLPKSIDVAIGDVDTICASWAGNEDYQSITGSLPVSIIGSYVPYWYFVDGGNGEQYHNNGVMNLAPVTLQGDDDTAPNYFLNLGDDNNVKGNSDD